MKGKRKPALLPASAPDSVLYARVLSGALTRSQPYLTDSEFKAWNGAIRARNWPKLVELAETFDSTEYVGVLDQYVKSQLVALVKKYPFTTDEVPGFDPELTAWKKFQKAEHTCKRVNQRLAALRYGDGFVYARHVRQMRRYIRDVLGETPDIEKIYGQCDFGPGASVGVTGDLTNFARKFLASKWTVTRLALPFATQALWRHEQFRHLILGGGMVCYDYEKFSEIVAGRVELVTHNNVSFVPKTFKTKRSIASEPLLNGYLQKGIDQYMRERLARHGFDLRDQGLNQELARVGSLGGDNPYCTIDLTSASDSMSYGIVKYLLPPRWFDLLDRTRSHVYNYRGDHSVYHKFVSMGNGFCFPLQTLLFAAAAHACSRLGGSPDDFIVYGDDIVVRRSIACPLLEILKWMGFRNNPDKTFLFGRFRESCGTDWYSGLDIRPVYLDFRLRDNRDLYKFHNSTLRSNLTFDFFVDVRPMLRLACPEDVRFVRPYHGNADSAFSVELDVAMSSRHVSWVRETMAWSWREVLTLPVEDRLWGIEPVTCNVLQYLAVLRGGNSSVPLAVRRKTRASIRRVSYWALSASLSWRGAEPIRGESPR